MDADTIASLIGSVGFPIIACAAMAYFYATQFNDFQSMLGRCNLLTEELIGMLKERNGKDGADEADSQPLH